MKVYRVIITMLVAFSGLAVSCNPPAKDNEEDIPEDEKRKKDLFEQARDIHDEAMPYIDSIFTSKGKVQEEIDRITNGLKEVHESRKDALEEIGEELDDARESMMLWMRKYGRMPSDTLTNEEVFIYLEESLKNIEDVRTSMEESLKKANQILMDSVLNE